MTIKAEITTVALGSISFQGLMNENGEFGIAVPQIAEEFQLDKSQASRQLKTLLGNSLDLQKWKTPINPKPVNTILIKDLENVIFKLAQKGIPKAVECWNQLHPDKSFNPNLLKISKNNEKQIEDFVMELYADFNPVRQVVTEFGIADVVHDFGVVEIKEFNSIRSLHTAIGQAMSYGAILRKQPEVLVFNVPDSAVQKVLQMFTAVGILVMIYDEPDTKQILQRKKWHPTHSNANEISFQIQR
jgi:hypothetical protein